jgi:hypothetical protein
MTVAVSVILVACLDSVVKCHKAWSSDDEVCAFNAEFRQQLDKLEALAQRVPRCVVQDVLSTALGESSSEQEHHAAQFAELKDQLDSLKVSRCCRFFNGYCMCIRGGVAKPLSTSNRIACSHIVLCTAVIL